MFNRDPEKMRNYLRRYKLGTKEKVEIVCEQYQDKLGKNPNLREPKSFTEKLNYMKLFYENPLIPKCCDKYELKKYIKEKLGEEYSAKTLLSTSNFTVKDFETLPEEFVLKVNWSSGYNILVHDKTSLSNREKRLISTQLLEWTKPHSNSYFYSFYRGYRDLKPVVFAEEMLPNTFMAQEYKVFCFSGNPEFVLIELDPNGSNHRRVCVDLKGMKLPFSFGSYPVTEDYIIPNNYSEIIRTATILARDFPFVRVDYLTDGKRLVIGEMTFYSGGGYSIIHPEGWDNKLGSLLNIETRDWENEETN